MAGGGCGGMSISGQRFRPIDLDLAKGSPEDR